MLQDDFDTFRASEMFCQVLREINRTVLASGAAERDHQAGEAALAISRDAGIDQRGGVREKLADARLAIEIVDDGRVAAGECSKFLFSAGIGQAAGIEDESAAIA